MLNLYFDIFFRFLFIENKPFQIKIVLKYILNIPCKLFSSMFIRLNKLIKMLLIVI